MRHEPILLVEDDANDVFFLKDALRRTGLDLPLNVANDGQEAIDFLTRASAGTNEQSDRQLGLVLLDLNLPRRSGLEVLGWIRKNSIWKTLIVIVLTSSTSECDKGQAYALGANSYVVKPTDATKLRELIKLLAEYWLGWNEDPPVAHEALSEQSPVK